MVHIATLLVSYIGNEARLAYLQRALDSASDEQAVFLMVSASRTMASRVRRLRLPACARMIHSSERLTQGMGWIALLNSECFRSWLSAHPQPFIRTMDDDDVLVDSPRLHAWLADKPTSLFRGQFNVYYNDEQSGMMSVENARGQSKRPFEFSAALNEVYSSVYSLDVFAGGLLHTPLSVVVSTFDLELANMIRHTSNLVTERLPETMYIYSQNLLRRDHHGQESDLGYPVDRPRDGLLDLAGEISYTG